MEIKRDFVMREVAGERILVPAGRTSLDLNGMLTLNEVAASIWELLPKVENEAELIDRLFEEYEVERCVLEADVHEFLGQLKELGIV